MAAHGSKRPVQSEMWSTSPNPQRSRGVLHARAERRGQPHRRVGRGGEKIQRRPDQNAQVAATGWRGAECAQVVEGRSFSPRSAQRARGKNVNSLRRETIPSERARSRYLQSQSTTSDCALLRDRNGDLAGLAQTDGPCRSWRQIDLPAAYKRPAIIDPHNHATTVTNSNKRPEWQGAVSRGHCRTIEMLSICGATAAKAVASTVNACHFRTRNLTAANSSAPNNNNFTQRKSSRLISPPPRFRTFQVKAGRIRRHPQTVSTKRGLGRISGKISAWRRAKQQQLLRCNYGSGR